MEQSAAIFDSEGQAEVLTIGGRQALMFREAAAGTLASRLLVENDAGILSVVWTDMADGDLRPAFETIVASLTFGSDGAAPSVEQNAQLQISETLDILGSAVPQASDPSGVEVGASSVGYRLPWRASVIHYVLQGWGGSYSHYNAQMWYAYDFDTPEGEEIRASQGGTVFDAVSNYTACGGYDYRNLANRVTVYHSDGTATLYLHLSRVDTSDGASVQQGDSIGLAGKTGYTGCSPHLHFQRQGQGVWITTVAVYFDEYPNQQLVTGPPYISLIRPKRQAIRSSSVDK
jgi:murein DD-endopeptidase MepM/ murein hydrolase activator NlpD